MKSKKINIPNVLTLARIWIIPVIVATFFVKEEWAAWVSVVLFGLAGITDYMDGYLARQLKQGSCFGRVLDPIADKLLVGVVLVMLAYAGYLDRYYMVIPACVILSREILVSGLREFLAEIKVGMPVTKLAKWKTTFQMFALPILLAGPYAAKVPFFHFEYVGPIAFWFAAVMTVITGYDYWKSGSKYLNKAK